MKHLLLIGCLVGASLAWAVPSISNVSAISKNDGQIVRITYVLGNEPAVVTLGLYDKTTGAYICEGSYTNLSGDVNRLVQPGGNLKEIVWTKDAAWTLTDADTDVRLRVWTTNCPPDYLVIDLTDKEKLVPAKYYVSTNAFPVPLSDVMYRTTHLVMRKIPAANVEWRMGSPAQEADHEAYNTRGTAKDYSAGEKLHYVRLTEDYYLGIYPVTYRQHMHASGQSGKVGAWGDSDFADVRQDDWPYSPVQFVMLRSWMHDSNKGCHGECGVAIKYWPENGHDIDAAGALKCLESGGTYTPYLRNWRDHYGFEFDIPTDAQWEFACRAGTGNCLYTGRDKANYTTRPTTNQLNEISWNLNNAYDETVGCHTAKTVGQKRPNAFGLYDMIGNVFEWCLDVDNAPSLSAETSVDPVGPYGVLNDRDRKCILRGGSYCSHVGYCRSAARAKAVVPFATNSSYSDDTIDSAPSSSWHIGYRLWLPAQAAR